MYWTGSAVVPYSPAVDSPETVDRMPADLRIGTPEREAARTALDEHLEAERLTDAEYEERSAACDRARTESELRRVFADLPPPHPDLRPQVPPTDDEDPSVLGWTIGIALGFGLPVGIVLGVAYGAWWSLTVPVAVSVVLLYAEHLLTRGREQQPAA
jgi:hypothetical protein